MTPSFMELLFEDDGSLEAALAFVTECDVPINDCMSVELDGDVPLSSSRFVRQAHEELKTSDAVYANQGLWSLNHDSIMDFELQDAFYSTQHTCFLRVGGDSSKEIIEAPHRQEQTNTEFTSNKKTRAKRLCKRNELIQLRGQVKDMEEKIRQMKVRQQQRVNSNNKVSLRPLWKGISKRQFESRKKVELENQHLKNLVKAQIRVARSLQYAIQKRANPDAIKSGLGIQHHEGVLTMKKAHIDAMVAEMDELYVTVDKVLHNDRVTRSAERIRRRQGDPDALDAVVVEFVDEKVVPFDISVTERALWKSLGEKGFGPMTNVCYKCVNVIDDTIISHWKTYVNVIDDTIVSHLRTVIGIATVTGYNQMYRVTRKYIEASRIVIVSLMNVEPVLDSDPSPGGISYRQTRWWVLTRGNGHLAGPTTRIEVHSTISQHAIDTHRARRYVPMGYSEMAIRGWERSNDRAYRVFENLLLEEAIVHKE